jgi:hypothetical protein
MTECNRSDQISKQKREGRAWERVRGLLLGTERTQVDYFSSKIKENCDGSINATDNETYRYQTWTTYISRYLKKKEHIYNIN